MKDDEIFRNYPDEICYIPEHIDENFAGYTKNDFVEMCDGDERKAEIIFAICEWEHPETVLLRWDEEDEEALRELKAMGQFFDSEEGKNENCMC